MVTWKVTEPHAPICASSCVFVLLKLHTALLRYSFTQGSASFPSWRLVPSMQQNQPKIQNWQNPSSVQFHLEQGPASIIHHLFLSTTYIPVLSLFLDGKGIKPLEDSKWFTCLIKTSQCNSIQYVTLCCFTSITVSLDFRGIFAHSLCKANYYKRKFCSFLDWN